MNIEDLKKITASVGVGEKGNKTFYKIVNFREGKFGMQCLIDITNLNQAIEEGAYSFKNKDGHKILTLNPKIWDNNSSPKFDKGHSGETSTPHEPDILDDSIPF